MSARDRLPLWSSSRTSRSIRASSLTTRGTSRRCLGVAGRARYLREQPSRVATSGATPRKQLPPLLLASRGDPVAVKPGRTSRRPSEHRSFGHVVTSQA
jgi:hypothetical protein